MARTMGLWLPDGDMQLHPDMHYGSSLSETPVGSFEILPGEQLHAKDSLHPKKLITWRRQREI